MTVDQFKKAAKAELTVTEDDDQVIPDIMKAATEYLEDVTGQCMLTTTWEMTCDHFPHWFEIPVRPIQSIDFVKYLDASKVLQTLSPLVYDVDLKSIPGRIVLLPYQSWPISGTYVNAITIQFVAGYNDPEMVSPALKQAFRLLACDWFEHREDTVDVRLLPIPNGVQRLINICRPGVYPSDC